MKVAGVIIGVVGAILFIWHSVKVVMGTDIDTGYMSHKTLSLVGGMLILTGTWVYVIGRRRHRRPLQ